MGSIMSTGIVQGSSSAQSAPPSAHYPLSSQFTMGGPPLSKIGRAHV